VNPAAHSVRNRALVNAVFVLVVAVGIHSLLTMPRELNPRVGFNWAFITTIYTGAMPEEVEELVSILIEDEVQSVEDVDVILSRSRAGSSFVWVRFEQISERTFERRLDDIRGRVLALDLPEAAEDPKVEEFSSYDFQPVASVVVHGQASERLLHDVARELREDLRDIEGVGKVDPFGDRDRAVLVECDPHRLVANRLDLVDVEAALRLANLNLPAGVLKLGGQEYLLRTRSDFKGMEDIAEVALRAGPDGRRVLLGDVAELSDGFEERTLISRFSGEPSISLVITKNESGNTLDIVRHARQVIDSWGPRLPPGLELSLANDESLMVTDILGILQSNALMGMVLVVIALILFVGWRSALCAALGIPVTFLLAIVALDWTDHSLNGSTLFGLILVLGMVVDDAVVILENAYRHLQMGKPIAKAVVDGTREVVAPVAVSSLTTMAAFLPLVLMPGIMGKFMRIIPITVSLVLLASLVEALWILPSHFADLARPTGQRTGGSRMERLGRLYGRLLDRVLRLRYLVVAGAIAALVGSVMLIPLIGVDLFAFDEFSTFQVLITMPDGTRLEETDRVVRRFEAEALKLPEKEVKGVIVNVGLLQDEDEYTRASHVGQVFVDLVEAKERERGLHEIIDQLRAAVELIPGPVKLEFQTTQGGPPTDAPVELMVKGPDLDTLAEVSRLLQDELRLIDGVTDIRDDLNLHQPELDVVVNREAAARRGLHPTRIARSVRTAFAGTTATTFRQNDEEVDVIVRLPEAHRTSMADLQDMRLVAPTGAVVPLSEVAAIEERTGPLIIRRHDRERSVSVMAEIDESKTDIARVDAAMTRFFDRIQSLYPGVRLESGGQFREFWEAFESLTKLFALGLLLNFMLMAGQFKSWTQPLVIMSVVPLAFIGAMLGLLISGNPFSISTLYGFIALAGVAVNDSIVLVDFINQQRARGLDRWESLKRAAGLRLRPIMLTSITTIFGLMPMAIGLGGQSKTWQPLATTIAAGLAFATVICLLVLPCQQAILDDIASLLRRRKPNDELEGERT